MSSLIFLHGALGSSEQFHQLIGMMDGYDCHAFDFEGHGVGAQSERPYRIENFAEQLGTYIAEHNLAPATIFGYSMGGYVALWLAAHQPDLIHAVMTLGTKFSWNPEQAQREARMLNPEKMLEKIPGYAAELETRHRGANWRTVLEKTAEMMLDLGSQPRLRSEELSQIHCPVRVGIGDCDVMVGIDETIEARKNIPNAELYILPGTQHPFERVNPRRLAMMIRDFMA